MTKAIMTIHGYLTDMEDFGELYDHLSDYDCVHKCAVPGHAHDADPSRFTVDNTIAKILSDFDKLSMQYDEVDVVGYSMGGALTTYLCAIRDVHRAVLLAPSNKFFNMTSLLKWGVYMVKSYAEPLLESSGDVQDRLHFANKNVAKESDNVSATIGMAGTMLENLTITNFNTFKKLMLQCNKMLDAAVLVNGKITTPIHIVMGGLDELVPYKSAEYITTRFVDATVEQIDTLGHAMLRTTHEEYIVGKILEHLHKQ